MFQQLQAYTWLKLAVITVPLLSVPLHNALAKCGGVGEENYTTLNGQENGGQALRSVGPNMADAVLLPPGCSLSLAGIELKVKLQRRDLGSFDVFVSKINKGGKPYEVQVFATISDSTLTRDFKLVFAQPRNGVKLTSGEPYYFGIRKHVGALSTVILGNTTDPSVLNRPDVVNGAYFYNHLAQQPNANGPYEMKVFIGN